MHWTFKRRTLWYHHICLTEKVYVSRLTRVRFEVFLDIHTAWCTHTFFDSPLWNYTNTIKHRVIGFKTLESQVIISEAHFLYTHFKILQDYTNI